MYKTLKILLLSAVFTSFMTIGAFAAGEHDGAHSSSASHSNHNSVVTEMPEKADEHEGHTGNQPKASAEAGREGGHGGHGDKKESKSQGPDWPVLYGFAGINATIIATAALKRYVFKDRNEEKANAK